MTGTPKEKGKLDGEADMEEVTENEMKAAGWTWAQLKKIAANRVRWKSVAEALCSPEEQAE